MMITEQATQNSTVFVVDDDPTVLKSICALVGSFGLRTRPFNSAREFLDNYQADQAGCLISDVRMLGMSGVQLHEQLLEQGIYLPVILISAHADTPTTVRAMKNGAVTFLEKPCRENELLEAIQTALALDSDTRAKLSRRKAIQERIESLTESEREVMELIIDGQLNKQIASSLGVSIRTIESRRHNVFEKLQADSVAELVKMVLYEQQD